MPEGWYVYLAECRDNSYFAGVTRNITDVRESSDYIRNRGLKAVPWCRLLETKSAALAIQAHIRRLHRPLKEYIIDNALDCERVLSLSKKLP